MAGPAADTLTDPQASSGERWMDGRPAIVTGGGLQRRPPRPEPSATEAGGS